MSATDASLIVDMLAVTFVVVVALSKSQRLHAAFLSGATFFDWYVLSPIGLSDRAWSSAFGSIWCAYLLFLLLKKERPLMIEATALSALWLILSPAFYYSYAATFNSVFWTAYTVHTEIFYYGWYILLAGHIVIMVRGRHGNFVHTDNDNGNPSRVLHARADDRKTTRKDF